MEYVFKWSEKLEKIIDYSIDDNFLTTMKMNSDTHDSLAIIVIGQLRSFPELFEKFNILIESLKKVFPKVVIFFYISTEVNYSWRYKKFRETTKFLKSKYKYSMDEFKILIKDLNCEYYIKEKERNMYHNTHLSQLYDIQLCHLDIYKYEQANNIKFNYILKTRPDCYLKEENFDFNFNNIFLNNIICLNWDAVYTYPRDFSMIFDQFISEINKTNVNIFLNEIVSNYIKNVPEELIQKDTKMTIEIFIFLLSTQYLKIIKYKKISIFKLDIPPKIEDGVNPPMG